MRERFATVAGLRVRYVEEGSGAPVVLLHGASPGSSCDVWIPNLAALAARGLRLIALDQPGFGESDAPADPSVAFRTRFVPQFMEALALERADIVGHSQSGRIAVNLAVNENERVRRIVVVGTASLLPPLPDAAKGDAGEGDEGGATEPSVEEIRAMLESQLFDRSAAAAARARREAKARGKEGAPSTPPWQRLNEVALPMRLIYGRQDRAAEQRAALALERNPALDLHLVDRCGHLVMWDAPEAFASLAGDFLARQLP